jgi:hypothetical protein
MESDNVIVFGSHASLEAYRAESWLAALRAGGVTVIQHEGDDARAARAVRDSPVLIAFVSSVATEDGQVARDIGNSQLAGHAVVILLLDDTDVSECEDKCDIIDVSALGRRAAWSKLLTILRSHDVVWADPDLRSFWSRSKTNVHRRTLRARKRVIAGVGLLALAVAAYLVFGSSALPTKALPSAEPPVVKVERAEPIADPMPPRAVPITDPPTPVVANPEQVRDALAIQHVTACIAAGERVKPMSDEQIARIARTFFANPAKIQDTGLRDYAGVEANLIVKQSIWPEWHEQITSIAIKVRLDADTVVVEVFSNSQGVNATTGGADSSRLRTEYTVKFFPGDKPLIIGVFGEQLRQE